MVSWNPALTARWTSILSLTHQKNGQASKGSSALYRCLRISFYKYGNLVPSVLEATSNTTGRSFRKTGVALTYGYHFTPQLFGRKEDYLSLGFGINAGRYKFDPSRLTAFNGILVDPQLTEQSVTAIRPNVNIGIFYKSSAYYELESHYYIGFSVNQVVPGIIYKGLGLTNTPHATLHLGYRYFAERESDTYRANIMVICSCKDDCMPANIDSSSISFGYLVVLPLTEAFPSGGCHPG